MKLIMEWSFPLSCCPTLRRNSMARATPLKSASSSKSSSTLAGALNALSGKKAEAVAAAPVKAPKKAKTVVVTPIVVTPPSASAKKQVQKAAAPEAAAPVPEKGQAALTELLTATSKARKAAKADAIKAEAKAAKKAAKAASLVEPTMPAPVQGADSHTSFQATMPEAKKAAKAKKAKPAEETLFMKLMKEQAEQATPAFNDVLTAQYVMKVAEKQGCESRPGFSKQLLETYISGRCIQFISKVGVPTSKAEMKEAVASVSHNLYHPPLYNGLVKDVTPPEKIKKAEKSTSKKKKDKKADKIKKEGKGSSAAMPEIPFDTKRTLGGNTYYRSKKTDSTLTRAMHGAGNAALVAKQAAFDIPVDAACSLFNTLTGRHPERVPAAIRAKARETQRRVEEAPNFFAALIA